MAIKPRGLLFITTGTTLFLLTQATLVLVWLALGTMAKGITTVEVMAKHSHRRGSAFFTIARGAARAATIVAFVGYWQRGVGFCVVLNTVALGTFTGTIT